MVWWTAISLDAVDLYNRDALLCADDTHFPLDDSNCGKCLAFPWWMTANDCHWLAIFGICDRPSMMALALLCSHAVQIVPNCMHIGWHLAVAKWPEYYIYSKCPWLFVAHRHNSHRMVDPLASNWSLTKLTTGSTVAVDAVWNALNRCACMVAAELNWLHIHRSARNYPRGYFAVILVHCGYFVVLELLGYPVASVELGRMVTKHLVAPSATEVTRKLVQVFVNETLC